MGASGLFCPTGKCRECGMSYGVLLRVASGHVRSFANSDRRTSGDPASVRWFLQRSRGGASSRSLACAAARRFDGSVCSAFDAAKRLLDCQAAGGEPGAPSLESASSMSRWRYDIGWVCAEVAAAALPRGRGGERQARALIEGNAIREPAFPEGSLEPFFIRRILALVCNLLVDNFGKSCVWIAVSLVFCGLEATVQLLA